MARTISFVLAFSQQFPWCLLAIFPQFLMLKQEILCNSVREISSSVTFNKYIQPVFVLAEVRGPFVLIKNAIFLDCSQTTTRLISVASTFPLISGKHSLRGQENLF